MADKGTTMERPRGQSRIVEVHDRDRERRAAELCRRDIELTQRGRMILDVAEADLEICEQQMGSTHPTTWFFRQALSDAQRAWERLTFDLGSAAIERALKLPSLAVLTLSSRESNLRVMLIAIDGRTYSVEPVAGTPLAPVQWRLNRLSSPLEHGPYYVCCLSDGSSHCDCGEWIFRGSEPRAGAPAALPCKHLQALKGLGWLTATEWSTSAALS